MDKFYNVTKSLILDMIYGIKTKLLYEHTKAFIHTVLWVIIWIYWEDILSFLSLDQWKIIISFVFGTLVGLVGYWRNKS